MAMRIIGTSHRFFLLIACTLVDSLTCGGGGGGGCGCAGGNHEDMS